MLSMYEASVPMFVRGLGQLSHVLYKGAKHAAEKGLDPATLIGARLAPDMLTLGNQVQMASDAAKGAVARLAGVDIPSFADTEATFEEFQARIAKTKAFVEGVDAQLFKGSGERNVTIKARDHELVFSGKQYLTQWALPNFYFHVVTAYDILRHNGVAIGKRDYLGPF